MPNLVEELNQLDFSVYIGGALQAAVQAQHAASMSQVSFIQAVGFEPDPTSTITPPATRLRYVDFAYSKSVPNPHFGKLPGQLSAEGLPTNTDTVNPFSSSDVTLKVPFLTMLTIPALRIDEVTIDFNAKLTSTETSNVSSEFAASAELGINYKIVNFKASASYKRTSTRGTSVEKTYNMGVRVVAVGDELPEGLNRVLTMLEDSIASVNG